jgi:GDP-L-fucose synthase
MKKKVLVTGGSGLVGSALEADVKPKRSMYNLVNPDHVNEMYDIHRPTHVIHCAGQVGGIGGNMNHKGEYFYNNIMINTNVIEGARFYGVKKLVSFLSTCVFPDDVEYPLTEDKIHKGEPHTSNNAYAYAKRMADVQINAYREQYGTKYTSVIPTNIYGPNDNFSLVHGHVMPMLIHKMYNATKTGEDFVVWGTGKPLREFIYSKDVARLTKWVLDEYEEDEPIIFSTSHEISIRDLVDLLVQEFNFKGNVIFDDTKPDGQYRKPSDNSKIKKYLPDFEFTPIEVGIKETVNWFINNYENARK